MPKVSVIIPVYGVEKYISRCARSLFEQTLDDIEYIFVDDCTKDNSIGVLQEVLEQYPQRREQTRIVKLLVNSGQAAARKYGMQLATGDYIIHCDGDDWVDVEMYDKMWRRAIETNSDIVFCEFYTTDGVNYSHIHNNLDTLNKENVLLIIVGRMLWSLCGGLVRRSIISNNQIIYPTANNGEDFAIMIQQIYYAQRFAYIGEPLYYYYVNLNSITKEIGLDKYLLRKEQHCANINIVEKFFERENVLEKNLDVLLILNLYCRANFSTQVRDKNTRMIWYSIYPELDSKNFLFNNKVPLHLKLYYWAVKLHALSLYVLFSDLKHKFSKN